MKRDLQGQPGHQTEFARRLFVKGLLLALTLLGLLPIPAVAVQVTNGNDSGSGSLRQVIAAAAPGETITFAVGVTTVTLTDGELAITRSLTIQGSGLGGVTVQRQASAPNFRIFDISGGVTVTLKGLTIRNGQVADNGVAGSGFIGLGGGVSNLNSALTIEDCVVAENQTVEGGYQQGGGLVNLANGGPASLTVKHSTIRDNIAMAGGGGIHNFATGGTATVTLIGSTLEGNTSNFGGGLFSEGTNGQTATVTVTGSTLNDNVGAAMVTFGAGNGTANTTVTNSTIGGNLGGGLTTYAQQTGTAHQTLTHVTAMDNSIDTVAANPGLATTSYDRSVFVHRDNGVTTYFGVFGAGTTTVTSGGYNVSKRDLPGAVDSDLTNTDPLLDPAGLADNGGATDTVALLPGSPALDYIPPADCTEPADQRGVPRPQPDLDDYCDSGALEVQSTPVAAPTPAGSNVVVQSTVGSTTITTTFSNVTTGGTTTVTPIDPSSAGTLPGGFNLSDGSLAFEIKTTATFTGSANVCFEVPSVTDPAEFANLRVLHSVGKQDLAVANQFSNRVSVLLGNGSGGFGSATNFASGNAPHSVALGDFNADGKQDLATANQSTNRVSVLLGNGAGGFGAATNFAAGSTPLSVAVGDFNADGKLDLATANQSSNNVSVLLGNGAGGFSAATNFAAGSSPRSVAVGDFNADGKLDLATANQSSNNVSVLLGNGAGGFGAATNFAAGSSPRSVAVGDFNADGKLDLVTANFSSNNVSVLLGNGTGGFGAATNFTAGSNPFPVAVGDFNADGKLDLVTANWSGNNVSVLLGNGAGGFGAATNFAAGSNPFSVAVGDFNADGKPDLITANQSSNNVSVLLGNGAGGFGAATNFAVGSRPTSVAVGNFNGDTTVIDQTILSGPDAPDFATQTICASVLSFSPVVLAEVVDNTSPTVTASLTQINRSGSNTGRFRVGFSATDNDDPAPAVSAIMEVPAGTESFQVVFERKNVDEAAIVFDLQRQRITLLGRDAATLRGLLATVRGNGGAAVTQDQVLLLHRWQGQQFSYAFRNGVLLAESAPTLRLKATARDAARNEELATVTPTFSP